MEDDDMNMLGKWPLMVASLALTAVGWSAPTAKAAAMTPSDPLVAQVQRIDYGINVFSYDSQLNAPSTIPALSGLNMGMQQFPNANEWSWVTNSFRNGGTAPVSLNDWGNILQATSNQGLFIFNYDENPTFSGGGTPQDAAQLTQYIVSHHMPISAIVIGSEEYGAWDHYANLNSSFSAQYYANQSALIAQAIHSVDPAMKVGVSIALSDGPNSLNWDQTVLRTDGPFINFVSVHDYPNQNTLSNAGLLSILPQEISNAMSFVKSEIAVNVPPQYASDIQTWVTEFNPYGEPGPQSVQPVYGAAMVESAMLWRAFGASKLFVWSYDGQAHVATSAWPVATSASAPFGLFALAGDGLAPELPMNTLYPSGQALAQYMDAIGSGGTLSVWLTKDAVVGQVTAGQHSTVLAINTTNSTVTVPLSQSNVQVNPTSMQILPGQQVSGMTTLSAYASQNMSGSSYESALPTYAAPPTSYPGDTMTLSGQGFGQRGANSRVIISQNGTNYGGPGDAYQVDITNWSPNAVTFVVPDGMSGPALNPGDALLEVETASQIISAPTVMSVVPAPTLAVTQLAPAVLYPGAMLTISGQDFGAQQNTGFVLISQDGINYGAPPDAYKLNVTSWSDNAITVQIPNGSSGPALAVGGATFQVTSAQGLVSAPQAISIAAVPTLDAHMAVTSAVSPGQWVTITGSGFGNAQGNGFLEISQNGVNYGAPGNYYPVAIATWSNTSITFMIPTNAFPIAGRYEESLVPGDATVTVTGSAGLQTVPMTVMVQ